MANKLRVLESEQDEIVEKFKDFLKKNRNISDSSLKYLLPREVKKKAIVCFSEDAWRKINALVDEFDTEVAWHGTVRRTDDEISSFLVDDIVVYPQEVTGATVNTDQEKYEKWLMGLGAEMIRSLRFHGHSHVNMGTSPSSVDTEHQKNVIEELGDDDFYIFMICNKKRDIWVRVYDTRYNTVYGPNDVEIKVEPTADISEFVATAKDIVVEKTFKFIKYEDFVMDDEYEDLPEEDDYEFDEKL